VNPVSVVVSDRGDDQLVSAGGVAQLLELIGDLHGISDELGLDPVGDKGPTLASDVLIRQF
jgi:hypothetical protein